MRRGDNVVTDKGLGKVSSVWPGKGGVSYIVDLGGGFLHRFSEDEVFAAELHYAEVVSLADFRRRRVVRSVTYPPIPSPTGAA